LAVGETLADELDNLRALGELAMIEGVACLELAEVQDRTLACSSWVR
jgi:hypothetical protein